MSPYPTESFTEILDVMRLTLTTVLLAVLASLSVAPCSASVTAPVYPGAVPGTRPQGVGLKAPPAQVKAYSTPDAFATVKAWYQSHLKDAAELQQPGMQKTEDAFLVGTGDNGVVVMIQSFKGKTWILIGPPM
jgi:hypothetical protein